MANDYEIDYNDSRFTDVETEKTAAINEVDETYGEMIDQSNAEYDKLIQGAEEWKDQQTQLQNEQTDFAIEQINQQKEQERKDYLKEQSGAYVDWQKQSNEYGANAEQQAAMGMANTGFSESSQVSMYNTYQNRVASARASHEQAVLNYNNQITEAKLQNNSILAEIAYNTYMQQAEYSLQKLQNQNTLLLEMANKKLEVDQMYYQRYQDVLAQINQENALAEEIRQYNETMAEEKRQYDATLALQKEQLQLDKDQFAWQKAQASSSGSSGGSSSGSSGGSGGKINKGTTKSTSKSNKGTTSSAKISATSSKGAAADGATARATNKDDTSVSTKSVISLGQGPISGSNLANQVNSGKVIATKSGGDIFVNYANPTNRLLYSQTRLK